MAGVLLLAWAQLLWLSWGLCSNGLAKSYEYGHFTGKPWRWRRHRGPEVDPLAQPPPLAGQPAVVLYAGTFRGPVLLDRPFI